MGQALSNTNELNLQTLNVTKNLINADITSLEKSTNTGVPELIAKYSALSANVTKTINDISGASPDILRAKQNQFNSELIELNIEKKNILDGSSDFSAKYIFKIITYSAGMILAIIIITNTFIDKRIYYKILYSIWGALLYPLVLLYGVYDPPNWKAIIIPLFEKNENSSTNIILSAIQSPFSYTLPSPDDINKNTSKYALQAFSAICLASFGIAYTL